MAKAAPGARNPVRSRRRPFSLPTLLLAGALGLGACADPEPGPAGAPPGTTPGGTFSVSEALGGSGEGFLRAIEPRAFTFPADHGPHPGFRTEWWYFTGNLGTEPGSSGGSPAGGRRFGFQLTFFRNQLAPDAPERSSSWAAEEIYMGHFAMTDGGDGTGRDGGFKGESWRGERSGRFYAFERFARAALDLAGAHAGGPAAGVGSAGEAFRVWLEDWEVSGEPGGEIPPLSLRAAAGEVALELTLGAGKPPVFQGRDGLSQKGPEAGNASYYYSLTRLPAAGSVVIGGERFPVTGLAWMDREWSTSVLGPEQVGWDWFSLQLSDGRDLMLYQLRRADGTADPYSAGSLVSATGTSRSLAAEELTITPTGRWRSPESGVTYPSRWRVEVPGEGLDLTLEPLVAGQELRLAFRYWEGAVVVTGRSGDEPIGGRGYAELTGYE